MKLVSLCVFFTAAAAMRSSTSANSSVEAGSWSPWTIAFKGMQCLKVEPTPFSALAKKWPKCLQQAIEKGQKLAENGNCRLCDVSFKGSKPEADQTMTSKRCEAVVTCSAVRLGPNDETCYSGHGDIGKVVGLNSKMKSVNSNPEMPCLPCPSGCKECGIVGNMFMTQRKFKCIVSPAGTAETGLQCVPPSGFECGACSNRRCGGMMNIGCSRKDFKSDCKFPAKYENQVETVKLEDYQLILDSGADTSQKPPVLELFAE